MKSRSAKNFIVHNKNTAGETMQIGFDNEKYLKIQSEHIKERISQFGDKLYLEFGGKLFDDYHASRVLPGFQPDSKLKMLMQLADVAEIIIAISATDIEKNKVRSDLGITYDMDVIRLIGEFQNVGLNVTSVVITHYAHQASIEIFKSKLEKMNIKTYFHYIIEGYPSNVSLINSENGFGKNDYVQTSKPLVVVTAPGPGSGKMATCLSQLYHDNKHGIKAGYAKFETFPIWNIPLKHPVNIAYEAATADLNDVNMIDPFHLEAYGKTTVNYNRDIEIFPVLNSIFTAIYGKSIYKSPTDMGVNMAGNCIIDDEVCKEASKQEIIRRYYAVLGKLADNNPVENELYKIELLMQQVGATTDDRKVTVYAKKRAEETGVVSEAIELTNEKGEKEYITSKASDLLGASAALLLNALKHLAGIDHSIKLIPAEMIEPIQNMKTNFLKLKNPRLNTDEVLVALAILSKTDENCKKALEQLPHLKNCKVHTTAMLSEVDIKNFKKLEIDFTSEPSRKKENFGN